MFDNNPMPPAGGAPASFPSGYDKGTDGPSSFVKVGIFAVIFVMFVGGVVGAIFLVNKMKKRQPAPAPVVVDDKGLYGNKQEQPASTTDDQGGRLRDEEGQDGITATSSNQQTRGELVYFHNYYDAPRANPSQLKAYALPINVKDEAANYHEVNRQIPLTAHVASLNAAGFAVIKDAVPGQQSDFFAAYDYLSSKGVPLYVTSDFLAYYFQNSIKQSYKDIEKTVFYDNLWSLSKKIYETSVARYKKRLAEVGLKNDPLLEGARMEAAYFAVILEILKPLAEQTVPTGGFNDDRKFTQAEASRFDYILLDSISEQVKKELVLIREGKKIERSPVMQYVIDYSGYKMPDSYKDNAKLNNFYLANRWLYSGFPLYKQGGDCEKCLVDQSDWRISMIAASLIAKDFAADQSIRNDWAVIYKVVSFFNGLRGELNYLHYVDAINSSLGNIADLESYLAVDLAMIDERLDALQSALDSLSMKEVDGAYDRATEERAKAGMRLLQEPFWPSKYIADSLTYPEVGTARADGALKTSCPVNIGGAKSMVRCVSPAIDTVNLISPMSGNIFFDSESQYDNYGSRSAALAEMVKELPFASRHSNNYWTTFSLMEDLMSGGQAQQPAYASTDEWKARMATASMAIWTNLQLPGDVMSLKKDDGISGLNAKSVCADDDFSYVDTNQDLMEELIANADMLYDAFLDLEIGDENDLIQQNLSEIRSDLEGLREIMKRELENQPITASDCRFIRNVANKFRVEKPGRKDLVLTYQKGKKATEYIDGVNLIAVVNNHQERKGISIGPIFRYREEIK